MAKRFQRRRFSRKRRRRRGPSNYVQRMAHSIRMYSDEFTPSFPFDIKDKYSYNLSRKYHQDKLHKRRTDRKAVSDALSTPSHAESWVERWLPSKQQTPINIVEDPVLSTLTPTQQSQLSTAMTLYNNPLTATGGHYALENMARNPQTQQQFANAAYQWAMQNYPQYTIPATNALAGFSAWAGPGNPFNALLAGQQGAYANQFGGPGEVFAPGA